MNKTLTLVLAYLFKYLKCLVVILITAGIAIVILGGFVYEVIIPVVLFELFAFSVVYCGIKYLSRNKNPNFKRVWDKHLELLDELNKANRFDEFRAQNTLLSKSNSFKNAYSLYKASYTGTNQINADQFKEKFDNGELESYILGEPGILSKNKRQIIALSRDNGINNAGSTIVDEAQNGKKSTYQTILFSNIPYIVIGALALIGFIITIIFLGEGHFGNIAMISGASLLVIMLVCYFEFKGKFETLLQSIVVMNNMIQYFLDKKEEIPQFVRNADELILFYERKKE